MRLADRTALVTGATSNIGRAIAVAFGAEGAHVVVTGRDAGRGEAVVAEIRAAGGKADFVAADLDGSPGTARQLAEQATAVLGGRIDILVNNAGAIDGTGTVSLGEEALDRILAVNVKAPFFLTAAIAPAMAAAGGGTIVNLGSWVARLGLAGGTAYAASKGALETLTRAWSAEFGASGVRVNAISPGVVYADPDPRAAALMAGTPSGTVGHPDEIARAAVFLASDDARFLHATVLDVDGGRTGVAVVAR